VIGGHLKITNIHFIAAKLAHKTLPIINCLSLYLRRKKDLKRRQRSVTFSCISEVDWASQKATVATSLRMGISMEQSRPSRRATRGRVCIGPFAMGPMREVSIRGLFGSILRLSIRRPAAITTHSLCSLSLSHRNTQPHQHFS